MTFHSLRFKTGLFVATTMAIAVCVLSGTFIVAERQKDTAEILQNGQVLANFSASAVYDSYTQFYAHTQDFNAFKTQLQNVLDLDHDIVDVTLMSINGRILVNSSELEKGKYQGSVRATNDTNTLDDLQKTAAVHRPTTLPNGQNG